MSSPAPAARETAAALGLEAAIDAALRDLDMGVWRGRGLADIAAADPASLARWTTDPTWAAEGGETIEALVARMAGFLDIHREGGGTTVAITHPAVIRAALVAALGAPSSTFWRIDVPPLACLTLGTDARRWTLRSLA